MNKTSKSFWSNVILDSYISFILFSIFATIMLIYVIFNLDLENNINNFVKSIEKYLNYNSNDDITILINNNIFLDLMEKVRLQSIQYTKDNKSKSDNFYNTQVIISTVYLISFTIIFIFVLYFLDFKLSQINWKIIGILIFINIIVILLFELLFIYMSVEKYNICKINNILKLSLNLAVN